MTSIQTSLFEKPAVTPAYAQVMPVLEVQALDRRTFTYHIPEEYRQDVQIGIPVHVPFGRQPGITGFVVGFSERPSPDYTVKEILDVLDDRPLFNLDYLSFLDWVASYYACSLAQALTCALPAKLIQKPRKEVRLHADYLEKNLSLPGKPADKPSQKVLAFLTQRDPKKIYTPKFIAQQTGLSQKELNKSLARLKHAGLIGLTSELSGKSVEKTVKIVRPGDPEKALKTRHQQIIAYLQSQPTGMAPLAQVIADLATSRTTLIRLAELGALVIEEQKCQTNEKTSTTLQRHQKSVEKTELTLSAAQQAAVRTVLNGDNQAPYLLFGVTGSGKTEVYLSLTEAMLQQGKGALILLPEIALTSQIAGRFIARFGREQIAVWHSNLNDVEKVTTWWRLMSGELKILIGARSAIFAPIQPLGLIILDEEHDGSFKQDSPAPRYHARTLACELAKRTGAKVLLGSATPDVISYTEALQKKRLLYLPERFGSRPLATVHVVDMRKERQQGNTHILSRALKEALKSALESEEQAIILINRRGFHTLLTCADCNHLFLCRHCDVALTYHRADHRLRCHYCGFEEALPKFCPECASYDLTLSGTGTQRVEEEITAIHPSARILRLDGDVMQKKYAYQEIFETFSAGEADILVGTQMVAKGLDIANVTLVGVINADSTFYLPDFKSAERGFQLLTQVAGRAGRGDKAGRVIIQTLDPNHAVIQYAQAQDYENFYQYELLGRKNHHFPPYAQLFRWIVSAPEEYKARRFIEAALANLKAALEKEALADAVSFLGPASCLIPRIQGRYRYHCLIKNTGGETLHRRVGQFHRETQVPEDIHFILDVDPQSLV